MYNEKIPYLFIENTKDKSPQLRIPIDSNMDQIQVTIQLGFFNLSLKETYFADVVISDENGSVIYNFPIGTFQMKEKNPQKPIGSLNGVLSPIINNPKVGNYMLSAHLFNDKKERLDSQYSYFSFAKKDDENAK